MLLSLGFYHMLRWVTKDSHEVVLFWKLWGLQGQFFKKRCLTLNTMDIFCNSCQGEVSCSYYFGFCLLNQVFGEWNYWCMLGNYLKSLWSYIWKSSKMWVSWIHFHTSIDVLNCHTIPSNPSYSWQPYYYFTYIIHPFTFISHGFYSILNYVYLVIELKALIQVSVILAPIITPLLPV